MEASKHNRIVKLLWHHFDLRKKAYIPQGIIHIPVKDTAETLAVLMARMERATNTNIEEATYVGVDIFPGSQTYLGDLLIDNEENDQLLIVWTTPVHNPNKKFQIFIKGIDGKTVTIDALPTDTIKSIKNLVQYKTSVPLQSQQLVYNNKYLSDKCLLKDYHISKEATINMTARLVGGHSTGFEGVMFADITHDGALQSLPFSSNAPEWRCVTKGINIEGYCSNSKCAAYNKCVIVPLGFGQVTLLAQEFNCPMCDSQIEPITCGFYCCQWTYVGRKAGESRNVRGNQFKQASTDRYDRFSEARNLITWIHLVLVARAAGENKSECPICLKQMQELHDAQQSKCGHSFHKKCVEALLRRTPARECTCPLCGQLDFLA